MKKIILFTLVFCAILSYSNDENSNKNVSVNELNGIWHLTNVTCHCAPVDFLKGEHVWDLTYLKTP